MTLAARGKATLAGGAAAVATLVLVIGCGSAGQPTAAGPTATAPATTAPAITVPATTAPASTAPASTAPAATTPALSSGDQPAGFWYGTDSSYAATPGPAPYHEPGDWWCLWRLHRDDRELGCLAGVRRQDRLVGH